MESFDDLEPVQVPVSIGKRPYILLEALEDAACKYRNALIKGMRVKQGGDGVDLGVGAADSEPVLVANCLFVPDKDGKLQLTPQGDVDLRFRVPVETVLKWPNRIVKKLFDIAKRISKLDEDDSKKELTPTDPTGPAST